MRLNELPDADFLRALFGNYHSIPGNRCPDCDMLCGHRSNCPSLLSDIAQTDPEISSSDNVRLAGFGIEERPLPSVSKEIVEECKRELKLGARNGWKI